jgi:hypothetical protein
LRRRHASHYASGRQPALLVWFIHAELADRPLDGGVGISRCQLAELGRLVAAIGARSVP